MSRPPLPAANSILGNGISPNTYHSIHLYSLRVDNLLGALLPSHLSEFGDANVFVSIRFGEDPETPTAVTNMCLLDDNGSGRFDVGGFSKGSHWIWHSSTKLPALEFTFWSFVAKSADPALARIVSSTSSSSNSPSTSARGSRSGSVPPVSGQGSSGSFSEQTSSRKKFCGWARVQLHPPMLTDGNIEFQGSLTTRNDNEAREFLACETLGKVYFTIKAIPTSKPSALIVQKQQQQTHSRQSSAGAQSNSQDSFSVLPGAAGQQQQQQQPVAPTGATTPSVSPSNSPERQQQSAQQQQQYSAAASPRDELEATQGPASTQPQQKQQVQQAPPPDRGGASGYGVAPPGGAISPAKSQATAVAASSQKPATAVAPSTPADSFTLGDDDDDDNGANQQQHPEISPVRAPSKTTTAAAVPPAKKQTAFNGAVSDVTASSVDSPAFFAAAPRQQQQQQQTQQQTPVKAAGGAASPALVDGPSPMTPGSKNNNNNNNNNRLDDERSSSPRGQLPPVVFTDEAEYRSQEGLPSDFPESEFEAAAAPRQQQQTKQVQNQQQQQQRPSSHGSNSKNHIISVKVTVHSAQLELGGSIAADPFVAIYATSTGFPNLQRVGCTPVAFSTTRPQWHSEFTFQQRGAQQQHQQQQQQNAILLPPRCEKLIFVVRDWCDGGGGSGSGSADGFNEDGEFAGMAELGLASISADVHRRNVELPLLPRFGTPYQQRDLDTLQRRGAAAATTTSRRGTTPTALKDFGRLVVSFDIKVDRNAVAQREREQHEERLSQLTAQALQKQQQQEQQRDLFTENDNNDDEPEFVVNQSPLRQQQQSQHQHNQHLNEDSPTAEAFEQQQEDEAEAAEAEAAMSGILRRTKVGVTLLSATGDVAPENAMLAAQISCFAQNRNAPAPLAARWTPPVSVRGGIGLFSYRQEFVVTHADREGVIVSVIVAMKSASTAVIEQNRGGGVSTPQVQPEHRLFAAVRVDPAKFMASSSSSGSNSNKAKPKVLSCELYPTMEAALRRAFDDKSSPRRLQSRNKQQQQQQQQSMNESRNSRGHGGLNESASNIITGTGSSLGLVLSVEPVEFSSVVPKALYESAVLHLCVLGAAKLDRTVRDLLAASGSSTGSSSPVSLYSIVRVRSRAGEREFRSPTVRVGSSNNSTAAITPRWYFSAPPVDCALNPDITISIFLEDPMGFDELVGAATVPFVKIREQDSFIPELNLPLFFSDADRSVVNNNNSNNNSNAVATQSGKNKSKNSDNNNNDTDRFDNANGVVSIAAAIRPNPLTPQHNASSMDSVAAAAASSTANRNGSSSSSARSSDVAFLEVQMIQASNLIPSQSGSQLVVARVVPAGCSDVVAVPAQRDNSHSNKKKQQQHLQQHQSISGCSWPPTAEPGEAIPPESNAAPPLLFELQAPPSTVRFSLWDSESKQDAQFLGEYELFLDTSNCVVNEPILVSAALRPRADALFSQDDLAVLNSYPAGFGTFQARVLMLTKAQHEERCKMRELAQRSLHEYIVQLQVVEVTDVPPTPDVTLTAGSGGAGMSPSSANNNNSNRFLPHRIEAHAGDPYSGGAPTLLRTAFEPGSNPKFRQNMKFTLFRTTEVITFLLKERRPSWGKRNSKQQQQQQLDVSHLSNDSANNEDVIAIAEGTLPVSTPESIGSEPRTTWIPMRFLNVHADEYNSKSRPAPRIFVRWRVFYPNEQPPPPPPGNPPTPYQMMQQQNVPGRSSRGLVASPVQKQQQQQQQQQSRVVVQQQQRQQDLAPQPRSFNGASPIPSQQPIPPSMSGRRSNTNTPPPPLPSPRVLPSASAAMNNSYNQQQNRYSPVQHIRPGSGRVLPIQPPYHVHSNRDDDEDLLDDINNEGGGDNYDADSNTQQQQHRHHHSPGNNIDISLQVYAPLHGALSTFHGTTSDKISDVIAFAHNRFKLDKKLGYRVSKPGLVIQAGEDPSLGELVSRGALASGDTVFLVQSSSSSASPARQQQQKIQPRPAQFADRNSPERHSQRVRSAGALQEPPQPGRPQQQPPSSAQKQQQQQEQQSPPLLRARELERPPSQRPLVSKFVASQLPREDEQQQQQHQQRQYGEETTDEEGNVVFNAPSRFNGSNNSPSTPRRDDIAIVTERLRELAERARPGDLVRSTLQLVVKGTIAPEAPVAQAICRYFSKFDPEIGGFMRRNEDAVDSLDIVVQGHPTKLADAVEGIPLQLPLWEQLSKMIVSSVDVILPAVFQLTVIQLFGYLPVLKSGFMACKNNKDAKFMFGLAAKRYETPNGKQTDQCWFYRDLYGLSTPELRRSRMPYSKIVDERG